MACSLLKMEYTSLQREILHLVEDREESFSHLSDDDQKHIATKMLTSLNEEYFQEFMNECASSDQRNIALAIQGLLRRPSEDAKNELIEAFAKAGINYFSGKLDEEFDNQRSELSVSEMTDNEYEMQRYWRSR